MKNQGFGNDRERVFQAADIVEVASAYTALKQRAGKYVGLCPFHVEKTPSFSVDSARKLYYCFGCHQGGDVFRLVMEKERFSFVEALRYLAERYNVQLTPTSFDRRAAGERKRLIEVNDAALSFFKKALEAPEGRVAREFLAKRGLKPESVTELRIGYAPPQWDRLTTHLRKLGIDPSLAVKAGMAVERSDGNGMYDRFRDRLIFPIFSDGGSVIAFGGRVLPGGADASSVPKFINSPETAIYSKGHVLYGLNLTRDQLRKSGEAVVVEGYLDFALLYQEGVGNAVGCLGTSLTRVQAKLLERHGATAVLNFDPDPAGRAAILRSLEMLFEEDVGARVLLLPGGLDPDEFILKEGAAAYQKLISDAPSGEIFALDVTHGKFCGDVGGGKVEDVTDYLRLLRHMKNPIRQDVSMKEACARFGIELDRLRRELESLPAPAAGSADQPVPIRPTRTPAHRERRLLLYCYRSAEDCGRVSAQILQLPDLACRSIFEKLAHMSARGESYDQSRISQMLDSGESSQLTRVLMEAESQGWPDAREIESCLRPATSGRGETIRLQAAVERAGDDPDSLREALRCRQDADRIRYARAK